MSVNTLGRRFKEELNTTPHRWLTEQRKAHVTSLLADTDMPLQEIADVCGFATPSYLWDFCKKHLKLLLPKSVKSPGAPVQFSLPSPALP